MLYLRYILLKKNKKTCLVSKFYFVIYIIPEEKYKSYITFGNIDPIIKTNKKQVLKDNLVEDIWNMIFITNEGKKTNFSLY